MADYFLGSFFGSSFYHYAAEAFDSKFVLDSVFLEIGEDFLISSDIGCPLISVVIGGGFQLPGLIFDLRVEFEA